MKHTIDTLFDQFPGNNREDLIPVLQQVQQKEGYISRDSIDQIASRWRISRSVIYGVASFYSQFRFSPPGEHSIKICLGTACHVLGGDFILNTIENEIGIKPGETTEDGRFDLDRVACLGCCAIAPVIMIDKKIHSRMTVVKIKEMISSYE